MEKYRLYFAHISRLNESIAEVIFDKGICISIEMMEEIEMFLCDIFKNDFGVLVNKIYPYTYSPGAKLIMGSMERMKSIASVFYNTEGAASTQDIINRRTADKLNVKQFNGLELGRQQAFDWLLNELT
jgi:hypothetical protein